MSRPNIADRLPSRFHFHLVLTVAIALGLAVSQWSCTAKDRTAVGPVRILFTGDAGGALDPCG
ncbi:MAG: hypothetical protein JSV26_09495 [bacterium]|nr:MAG: hypothetical protein JSV26_09495 [bacterium]